MKIKNSSMLIVTLVSWLSTSLSSVEAIDGICKLMVETQKYTCKEHSVTTQDGYILSLQNIPFGLQSGETPAGSSRPPVLLQHGLLMDGITWLLNPPHQSLAFILADNGYDVWISSGRGTKYSRAHRTLAPDDAAYWDWTWDELAAYDLPAIIQFVHDKTGQKLHYIGHSQGTLIALASLSKGLLTDQLRSAALLCPVAYLGHMSSPLARNAADNLIAEALHWLGIHEFNPKGEAVMQLLRHICAKPGIDCTHFLTSFTGQNCCMNSSIVDIFLRHEPQPTSTKNMIHFSQSIKEGTFKMYDYKDEDENKKHYGQPMPPTYDVSGIQTNFPIFLSHGGADALSDIKDVESLVRAISENHQKDKLVVQFIQDYAHADFVMGANVREIVYEPLISFLQIY